MSRIGSCCAIPGRAACHLLAGVLLVALVAPAASASSLRIDGEVYAQDTLKIIPPAVDGMWQFNITQMADDGAPVKKGQPVVSFDSSAIVQQLAQAQSELQEKQREMENLELDLAERTRVETLATAEAAAELDKAKRKTQQPRELIAGLAYEKLLAEKHRAERRATLQARREQLAAQQRLQEQRFTASEMSKLQADVARLQTSLAGMTLVAPRDGILMHRSSWNGEKFDVGSQVWLGQTVAEIPDPTTLAVRAQLPERDLRRVAVGTPARIVVEGGGGGQHLGQVVSMGRAVRSKSQVQPIPVIDVEIRLEDSDARLRTGQSVRVELEVSGELKVSRP